MNMKTERTENGVTITDVINDFGPETRSLIKALRTAGFTINGGHNGEDRFKFTDGLKSFVENLMACDDAALYVTSPAGEERRLYLVFGNSPGELVSDYSISNSENNPTDVLMDKVLTLESDKWTGRKQPTKLRVITIPASQNY